MLFSDCRTYYNILNGHVDFTNKKTTYGYFVPIICNDGYILTGGEGIECLSSGSWSDYTTCEIKGMWFQTRLYVFTSGTIVIAMLKYRYILTVHALKSKLVDFITLFLYTRIYEVCPKARK